MQSNLSASFSLLSSLFVAAPNLPSNYKTWLCLASTHTHTHIRIGSEQKRLWFVEGADGCRANRASASLPGFDLTHLSHQRATMRTNRLLFCSCWQRHKLLLRYRCLWTCWPTFYLRMNPEISTKKQGKVEQEKAVHECTTSSHILKSEYFINP